MPATGSPAESPPRIGMVATVRNRRGVISSVRPSPPGPGGLLHLVEIEYNDGESPLEETLLWELEPHARLLPPSVLPDLSAGDPMPVRDLQALVRACRWSARTPYLGPDGSGESAALPVSAPFHGAIQVEDYQLVPLLKALRMPRVSLLVADDVGIGKTIEAGLILAELLLRRRIRRVLVATPASLRVQWRDEMWGKFSLPFSVVDRDSTLRLRREMGMDANPWRSHSRIITSYHYLKQPDVLEQFRAASESEHGRARLPWDLLIVDEAHNLTPGPFGQESDLCSMLRQIAPLFEHRLFLTATPHNGHTQSFTGLLEMLDPVRFRQTEALSDAERERVEQVLVRRLKREINEQSETPRFCNRLPPQALLLELAGKEKTLSTGFSEFRDRVRALIREGRRSRRLAGNFAIEILGKRLLSCPTAFADSWLRVKEGLNESDDVTEGEVLASKRSVDEETVDDREAESRRQAASATVGAWLKPIAGDLEAEIGTIDRAVEAMGFSAGEAVTDTKPAADSRFRALKELIEVRLRKDGGWRDDERLVVFTEYKTTLDYLLGRLRREYGESERFLPLFGGMDDDEREEVKGAFNDPDDEVRVLVATDAASEGLNLQETARYLLHYDVPWNPARLEQRNGRLDRHGQPRDVTVWHFVSTEDQDLSFLDHVVKKVHTIREDLGATGEVFDEITYRRLIGGEPFETVRQDLDERIESARKRVDIPRDRTVIPERAAGFGTSDSDLEALADEVDFDPEALRDTLDAAMAVGVGRPRITEPDENGRCRFVPPPPASWTPVIDDTLRRPSKGGRLGAVPAIAFDPESFVITVGGRPVFKPRKDTVLLHLSHPLLQRGLSSLSRLRFPGRKESPVSRFCLRHGATPGGADALLLVTIEELAVNELRESFHHWIRTLQIPVLDGSLQAPLPHVPARALRPAPEDSFGTAELDLVRDLWIELGPDVAAVLDEHRQELTKSLGKRLETDRDEASERESARYQSRQGELSELIVTRTLARLDRELRSLKADREQGMLFSVKEDLDRLDRDIELKEQELARRKKRDGDLREELARERERVVKELIPRRFALRGEAQVLPVAVEVVLPGGAS